MLKKRDPRGDLGKWAESQVSKWLDARSSRLSGFAFHRYPDARAARGQLASQPSDFIVGVKTETRRAAVHLEVKETAQKTRIPRSKVTQYGKLLMFHWAGFLTVLVVYRSHFDDWTYLTQHELFPGNDTDEPAASFPFIEGRSFPSATSLLSSIFDKP